MPVKPFFIEPLNRLRPFVFLLTGYGNIATAVTAVKLGAVDYIAKPGDADDIFAALIASPGQKPEPPENPMSADRVAGSIFSASMSCVTGTCRKLHAG